MVEKIKVNFHKVEIDMPTEEEFFSRQRKYCNKYEVFRNWCKGNGVLGLDRASYPHMFSVIHDSDGNPIQNTGYMGTVATKDILHREVILAVPLNLCISTDQIKYGFKRKHCGKPDATWKLTQLGQLIESFPQLFSEEFNDAE